MDDRSGRLTVQELSKRFDAVSAVDRLSFTVEPGTITGFLGPNGSGKSTTLRMVLGLVRPTSGSAEIGGLPYVALPRPATVVGAVLETRGFHPVRTARRHLLVCTAAIGVPDAVADRVLETVGLLDAADHPVGRYSLGMRQRLAIAVALLGDPQLLVLDEPGNGLDPQGIAWLRAFLREFAGRGRGVLVSSHLLGEMEQTADQLVVISRGRCVYQGGLDRLRRSGGARVLVRCAVPAELASALARTGLTEIDSLPDGWLGVAGSDPVRIGDIALAAGVAVYGMEPEKLDLEQLFFRLTAEQRDHRTPVPQDSMPSDPMRPDSTRPGAALPDPALPEPGASGLDVATGEPVTAILRSELRKMLSTRMWWALGIPVVVLSVLDNLFGALLDGTGGAGPGAGGPGAAFVPLVSLAVTMTLTSVFGAVAGITGAAGEFRHHAAATTYLLTPSRGRVLLAKLVLSGLVGAWFGALAAVTGVPAGLLGGATVEDLLPVSGLLLAVIGTGMVVGALWGAFGAAVGTAIGNQVGALVGVLIYLLFVDRVFAVLLSSSDSPTVAAISSYLPGKAADIAVYDVLARGFAPPGSSGTLVEEIASVSSPPPWWGALLVLGCWTAVATVVAWRVGGRRDVT